MRIVIINSRPQWRARIKKNIHWMQQVKWEIEAKHTVETLQLTKQQYTHHNIEKYWLSNTNFTKKQTKTPLKPKRKSNYLSKLRGDLWCLNFNIDALMWWKSSLICLERDVVLHCSFGYLVIDPTLVEIDFVFITYSR